MDRKLAAILAADVVGYSALMDADEAGTHERLKAGRKDLFEPEIARHHGRIFKVMGDGMLAEFGSVVDAVECAVALQRGLGERNAALPEKQRIKVRIGINLGEVIVEGDDRYGEGVNVATRIEQLADPGGICVSGNVAHEVEKRLAFSFESMGDQKVKNIAKPIPVFRIMLDGQSPRAKPVAPRSIWLWGAAAAILLVAGAGWYAWHVPKPDPSIAQDPVGSTGSSNTVVDQRASLVVLPFDNLSDDKEQGFLADGITEDVTTALARVPGLLVMSRNAAFAYKGKSIKPSEIARDLNVRYLLEGSIRRVGEDMRINAQLIDSTTGGHVWAERFDGKWVDVFALQDKVVTRVATALQLKLAPNAAVDAGGTTNVEAYEAWLRGWDLRENDTIENFVAARDQFKKAIDLDPNFGAAQAAMTFIYWDATSDKRRAMGMTQDDVDREIVKQLAEAAKHPSPDYYGISGQFLVRQNRSDQAIEGLQKALALNPSESWIHCDLAQATIFNGRPADALLFIDSSLKVYPEPTNWTHYLRGLAYFSMDRFEDAAASLEQVTLGSSDYWASFYTAQVLLSTYGHQGRDADIATLKERIKPILKEEIGDREFTIQLTQTYFAWKNPADFARLADGLRGAGVPEAAYGMDARIKDRLTGQEISNLLVGHTALGVTTGALEKVELTMAPGTAELRVGNWSNGGTVTIEGDSYCIYFRALWRNCWFVYRNPGGTAANKNEFIQVSRVNRMEFSIVK